jgi:hypothetical protein
VTVFTAGPRFDARPPAPKESAFAYLDRSARAAADMARSAIEIWFADYTQPEAATLAARLRSRLDHQHRAAFFELLLYRWLLVLGHRVVEIEPKLADTWKSPDFLVESAGGGRFYLEAVSTEQDDLHAALKRKASRYGTLDLPLVVAVNTRRDTAGVSQALVGESGEDGLWRGPRGSQRRGLSAVLAFAWLDPWCFAQSRMGLFRHPDAERPLFPVDLREGVLLSELL